MNLEPRILERMLNRRDTLVLFSATGISLLLAACGGDDDDEGSIPTSTATQSTAAQPTATSATQASTSTTSSSTATSGTSTSPTVGVTATEAATESSTATPTTSDNAEDATASIVAAANAFLDTLSDDERSAVLFDWSDTEQKQRWSNLPEGGFTRAGLMWGNISDDVQTAWLALMQATLSEEGYNRVLAQWTADDYLDQQGNSNGTGGAVLIAQPGGQLLYGSQYYWVAIIGEPSDTDAWQWQWGGHHVTINATVAGSNVALVPSFIGVQPATYTDASGATIRPLGDIADTAFALLSSLDETQQSSAVLGDSVIDLVLGPGQDGRVIESEGLPVSEMTDEQQAAFLTLIGYYTGLVNDEDAAVRTAEIEEGFSETYFAWYGPTTEADAGYFRVTGPTIVIEYSPQSMGGNSADHIHGIYRDPTNDYGVKYTA